MIPKEATVWTENATIKAVDDLRELNNCLYRNESYKFVEVPTILPEKVMLDVPYERQVNRYVCDYASIALITHYWNIVTNGKAPYVTQEKLMEVEKRNTFTEKVSQYLETKDYNVRSIPPYGKPETFKKELAKGYPLLFGRMLKNGVGHGSVAIGYDKDGIFYHDPWYGPKRFMRWEDFPKREVSGPVVIKPSFIN